MSYEHLFFQERGSVSPILSDAFYQEEVIQLAKLYFRLNQDPSLAMRKGSESPNI